MTQETDNAFPKFIYCMLLMSFVAYIMYYIYSDYKENIMLVENQRMSVDITSIINNSNYTAPKNGLSISDIKSIDFACSSESGRSQIETNNGEKESVWDSNYYSEDYCNYHDTSFKIERGGKTISANVTLTQWKFSAPQKFYNNGTYNQDISKAFAKKFIGAIDAANAEIVRQNSWQ